MYCNNTFWCMLSTCSFSKYSIPVLRYQLMIIKMVRFCHIADSGMEVLAKALQIKVN